MTVPCGTDCSQASSWCADYLRRQVGREKSIQSLPWWLPSCPPTLINVRPTYHHYVCRVHSSLVHTCSAVRTATSVQVDCETMLTMEPFSSSLYSVSVQLCAMSSCMAICGLHTCTSRALTTSTGQLLRTRNTQRKHGEEVKPGQDNVSNAFAVTGATGPGPLFRVTDQSATVGRLTTTTCMIMDQPIDQQAKISKLSLVSWAKPADDFVFWKASVQSGLATRDSVVPHTR